MKKLDLAKILILFFITFNMASVKGQSPKEISDRFFSLYYADPDKAVDYFFSSNPWMQRKESDVYQIKVKLKNLTDQLGKYYGFEYLGENKAGENVRMISYVVRYDREPLRFNFFLYKPNDYWQGNGFSYSEDIDKDIRVEIIQNPNQTNQILKVLPPYLQIKNVNNH